MEKDEELEDLGPCCACGGTKNVRNIMVLDWRTPIPDTGWGCVVCGLPCDGAVAVLCDDCVVTDQPIREAVLGFAPNRKRIPIGQLTEKFQHDPSRHPELREAEEAFNKRLLM